MAGKFEEERAELGLETPRRSKKSKKRKLLGTLLFAVVNVGIIAATAILEFSKDASKAERIPFLGLNFRFIFAAIGCLVVILGAETTKYMLMMKKTIGKADLKTAFQVVVIGKYYDNITPLGAGGQPFQIYYLNKQGLPKGASASMPIAGFMSMQVGFALLALFIMIFFKPEAVPVEMRILAYIGVGFYLFLPAAILLFTIAPKTSGRIMSFLIRLLGRIKIIKDPAKTIESTLDSIEEYRSTIISMSSKRGLLISLLLLSLVYQVSMCSLPFFVLRAFGGAATWIESLSICVFIYAAITLIPTPGNAGAAEGSFYALFSTLTSSYLFWAMLVWRFFCYYIFLILGLGVFAFNGIKARRHKEINSAAEKPAS